MFLAGSFLLAFFSISILAAVCQDPGQWNLKLHPTMHVRTSRFGWVTDRFVGSLERSQLRMFLYVADLVHDVSTKLLNAADISCRDTFPAQQMGSGICDTMNFTKTLLLRRHEFRKRISTLRQIPAPASEPLPSAWDVLPGGVAELCGDLLDLVSDELDSIANFFMTYTVGKQQSTFVIFPEVQHRLVELNRRVIIASDRLTVAVTLQRHMNALQAEFPACLTQSIVFNETAGFHHTEILLHLLNTLWVESGSVGMLRLAETGTFYGQTPMYLMENFDNVQVTTVDPFRSHNGSARRDSVMEKLKPFGERVIVIPTTSKAASEVIKDFLFDIAFIDGGERSEEIRCWRTKVREHGYLVGHDFQLSMDWPFLREIFASWPCDEGPLFIAPDWTWFFRIPHQRKTQNLGAS